MGGDEINAYDFTLLQDIAKSVDEKTEIDHTSSVGQVVAEPADTHPAHV
jgi:hypothetical protein